jgi:PPE-repeat protein
VVAITYDGIAFLVGNGEGTFQNPIYSDSTFQLCGQLVASDVSGDGKLDLVNVNAGSGVVVMVGNGDGSFQAPATYASPGQVYSGTLGVAISIPTASQILAWQTRASIPGKPLSLCT